MASGRRWSSRSEADASELLRRLGFGPESFLMNDPKLFVDRAFLSSLLAELEAELGPEGARDVLFQIGVGHGLRDAERMLGGRYVVDGQPGPPAPCAATSLPMRLAPRRSRGAGLELGGCWPEAHEAEARLARLGHSRDVSCHLSAGYTSGWLSGTHDLDVLTVEIACVAAGAPRCEFRAFETEDSGEATRPSAAEALSEALLQTLCPHPADATGREAAPGLVAATNEEGRFEREQDAVHIWGPVMVLPFTTPDEALCTVEMLARDPAARSVRVVVIDLREQPIDAGFGAAGLERVLGQIGDWGAEAVLTGVSPLSAPILADLQGSYWLTRKDLPNAIASAFQIADAQRHPL